MTATLSSKINRFEPEPPAGAGAPANPPPRTLAFLLARMRDRSDFPALSATISAINQSTAGDDDGAEDLCNNILKDFALTSKLLKMVNTASFGHFGGTITTISKAVVIMGLDRVRQTAVTLMLLEHLHNKAQAARLKDDLLASYFSGMLSRQLVMRAPVRNPEEAFICATFHNLGRLLTSFYFPDESHEIGTLMSERRVSEMQASLTVLGVSYEELGIGVAKAWNFPARVIQSMQHIRDDRVKRPRNDDEKLRAIADLCAGVSDVMSERDESVRAVALETLVCRFGPALDVDSRALADCIQQAVAELANDPVVAGLRNDEGVFLSGAMASGDRYAQAVSESESELLRSALSENRLDTATVCARTPVTAPDDPKRRAMLCAGIEDVTTALTGEFRLNDVLRTILATMYCSMGFTRVLLYVRDSATNTLKSRFGMGPDIDAIIAGRFAIGLGETKDVFQAAVAEGVDVFIENVNAESIRRHVPDAYRSAIPARAFALFPISVKGAPIGLFYGDADAVGAIRFSAEELSLLKTLRNQAVIAIRQTA